jgi:hypothetical protein
MAEVDPIIIRFPALSQEGTVLEHPIELHDGRELVEGVEVHVRKLTLACLPALA